MFFTPEFILNLIKDNKKEILVYILLQIPLLIFGYLSFLLAVGISFFTESFLVFLVVEIVLYQIWLATLLFLIYVFRYNIENKLSKMIENRTAYALTESEYIWLKKTVLRHNPVIFDSEK